MADIEALLIAGPTASGKTALALPLAQRLGGVIINADSMQVYRGLEILSAAPTAAEQDKVPHRLFGGVDPARPFSVADWHHAAERELRAARESGRVSIFVGGTGLYFKCLIEGLAPIPDIPGPVRNSVRDLVAAAGPEALYRKLESVDPEMAERLDRRDRQRIARALEVREATGRSLLEWQGQHQSGALSGLDAANRVLKLVLDLPREVLYSRIDERFLEMIEAGALDEARRMSERNLDHDLPALKVLGLSPLIDHLEGRASLEEAIAEAQKSTRRYAKRQLTWFRNQFADWWRLDPRQDGLLELILNRTASGTGQDARI